MMMPSHMGPGDAHGYSTQHQAYSPLAAISESYPPG